MNENKHIALERIHFEAGFKRIKYKAHIRVRNIMKLHRLQLSFKRMYER